MNYWTPKVYDLFGHDESERAYDMYQIGVRAPKDFSHLNQNTILIDRRVAKGIQIKSVSSVCAINAVMRRQYISEVSKILDLWNTQLQKFNIDFQLRLPHERFNRQVGPCKGIAYDINGELIFDLNEAEILEAELPREDEFMAVKALMTRVLQPEKYASWIAPPSFRLAGLSEQLKLNR